MCCFIFYDLMLGLIVMLGNQSEYMQASYIIMTIAPVLEVWLIRRRLVSNVHHIDFVCVDVL